MEYNANSTGIEQVPGGEQETVVESQTQTGGTEELAFEKENRRNGLVRVSAGQETVVESRQDGTDDGSHVGEDSGDSRQPDDAGQAGQRKQSREENAAMRAARLRGAQEAQRAERARTDEMIAESGVVNPYTGKPFTGLQDYLDYARQHRESQIAQQAEKSGRTVEEITEEMDDRDFLRKMRRQQATQSQQPQPNNEEMDFLRRDVVDFVEKYPDVDLQKLENNQEFLKFCGSRFKKEPLAGLYQAFTELVGNAQQAAQVKAVSRANRSTGGGTSGGVTLTPTQQSALDKWNSENPEMAMTAKEFLSRK